MLLLKLSSCSKGFLDFARFITAGLTFLTSVHAKILSHLWWQSAEATAKRRAHWGCQGMEGTGLSGARTAFQTAALWHGSSTDGEHGSDTHSAHLNPPKGTLGSSHPPSPAHSPCPPITGSFSHKDGYRRIILRSSSGSMPESLSLQPWLCLPRVLAAARPSLPPRPGSAGSPGSGWFLRCSCSPAGSTRAVPPCF